MKPIIQDILGVSRTIVEAEHFVELWRTATEQAIYRTEDTNRLERFRDVVATYAVADQEAIESWSPDAWLDQITVEDFPDYVSRLREWLKTVPVFTIYIPVALPKTELRALAQELRQIKGDEWLLETKVDPNVLGGCAFIVDDVYHDYSLHGRLRRQPEVIAAVFAAYEN